MHRRRLLACLSCLAIGIALPPRLAGPQPALAQPGGVSAADFIRGIGERAIAVLRTPGSTLEQREATFRQILRDGFDMPFIGRFVLGRHLRTATPEQLAEFQAAFSQYVLQSYSARFGGYAGETFTVTGERPASERDMIVATRIERPSGGPILADWRVRSLDGRWRIIDVSVENVSMAVTQRSEFASLIQRGGLPTLIQTLQARTAKLPAVAGQ